MRMHPKGTELFHGNRQMGRYIEANRYLFAISMNSTLTYHSSAHVENTVT
jgi:hypothetical protein